MAAGVARHLRGFSRLGAWLRSDLPIARWIFLIIHLAILITTALALDADPPRLLIISLLLSIFGFFFGFGLLRPASPISRARLCIPVSVCAFFLTVLAAGIYYSLCEALDSELLRIPEFATQWVLLYGSWLYGDLSIIGHGSGRDLANILLGLAEIAFLVFIITWPLIAFASRRSASRFDLAMRFSLKLLLASLVAISIILPSHLIALHRGGFLSGIISNPSLRGASLSLLFSLGSLLILIFLRPFHRREANAQGAFCQHCGYDLRASPDRCPECGEPVTATN